MEYAMRTAPFLPPLIYVVRNIGDSKMEELTQRVGLLEKTMHQIQQDVAVLTARSENFATKADIGTLRTELLGEMGKSEKRTDGKFEKMALHFDDKLGEWRGTLTINWEKWRCTLTINWKSWKYASTTS